MFSSIFINIFLAQIVVGAIVVVFLKLTLDRQLLDIAYRHIDYWKPPEGVVKPLTQITLVTHKPLRPAHQERFQRITAKRFGQGIPLIFEVDRRLMGGAVVKMGDKVSDYSLRDRMRQALAYR